MEKVQPLRPPNPGYGLKSFFCPSLRIDNSDWPPHKYNGDISGTLYGILKSSTHNESLIFFLSVDISHNAELFILRKWLILNGFLTLIF